MSNALTVRIVSLMPKGDILQVNSPVAVPAPLPENTSPPPLLAVSPWNPLTLSPADIREIRKAGPEPVLPLPEQPVPFHLPINEPGAT